MNAHDSRRPTAVVCDDCGDTVTAVCVYDGTDGVVRVCTRRCCQYCAGRVAVGA